MNRSYVFLTILIGACSPEAESSVAALDPADERDFTDAFDRAVCFCEAQMLSVSNFGDPGKVQLGVSGVGSGIEGDTRLIDFAERRADEALDCLELPSRPARPSVATSRNGCVSTMSGGIPISFAHEMGTEFPDGFCRADFNYCLAQELQLSARSLVSAPRSRAVRDELLAEARVRFQTSAIEHASSLGFLADTCASPPLGFGLLQRECDRIEQTTYATHVLSRIADSISEGADLLEEEALSAMAAGDGISPGLARSPQAYMDQLWGQGGARFGAAERVMGDGDGVAFARAGRAGGDTLALDGTYADRRDPDSHVRLAAPTGRSWVLTNAPNFEGAPCEASTPSPSPAGPRSIGDGFEASNGS